MLCLPDCTYYWGQRAPQRCVVNALGLKDVQAVAMILLDLEKSARIAEGKVLAQYCQNNIAACVQGVDGSHSKG